MRALVIGALLAALCSSMAVPTRASVAALAHAESERTESAPRGGNGSVSPVRTQDNTSAASLGYDAPTPSANARGHKAPRSGERSSFGQHRPSPANGAGEIRRAQRITHSSIKFTNCGLPGYDESKLGPLAICDDEHCTHVFHARCIGTLSVVPRVTRLSDLPDPWYCPRCTLADMSEKRARPAQPPPPPTAPAHPTQLPPAPIAPTAAPFTIGAPGVRRSSRLAGRPPASR